MTQATQLLGKHGRAFLMALIALVASSQTASPQGGGWTPIPTGEETPSALVQPHVVTKLTHQGKVIIAVSVAVVGLAALAFSLPRWRQWNLFNRQYRFPRVESVPLRLGGKRSGGCMGRIDFG